MSNLWFKVTFASAAFFLSNVISYQMYSLQVAGVKSTRTAGGAGNATVRTWRSWRMTKMRMKTRRNESIMILTESLCVCGYEHERGHFY